MPEIRDTFQTDMNANRASRAQVPIQKSTMQDPKASKLPPKTIATADEGNAKDRTKGGACGDDKCLLF